MKWGRVDFQQGKLLIREGRVLGLKLGGPDVVGRQSPVVTLENYNRSVPNLTREDGKARLAANAMAKPSGPLKKF